jgi:hypothetical protein
MRNLALAHKKVVLARLTELCADAGLADAGATAHTLGLVIDGAIVAALVTRDPAVAENAGRAWRDFGERARVSGGVAGALSPAVV